MKSEKEKILHGELYDVGDTVLTKDRMYARRLSKLYSQTKETEDNFRTELLKDLLGSIGNHLNLS